MEWTKETELYLRESEKLAKLYHWIEVRKIKKLIRLNYLIFIVSLLTSSSGGVISIVEPSLSIEYNWTNYISGFCSFISGISILIGHKLALEEKISIKNKNISIFLKIQNKINKIFLIKRENREDPETFINYIDSLMNEGMIISGHILQENNNVIYDIEKQCVISGLSLNSGDEHINTKDIENEIGNVITLTKHIKNVIKKK